MLLGVVSSMSKTLNGKRRVDKVTDPENQALDSTRAISLDGRGFQFTGQVEGVVELGSFVTLRGTDGVIHLGQVDDVALTIEGTFRAAGRVLGTISTDGRLDARRSTPFAAAKVEDADATAIALLYGGTDVTLAIGSYLASDAPAPWPVQQAHVLVRAKRFGQDLRARSCARADSRAYRHADGDLRPECGFRATARVRLGKRAL